MSARGRGYAQDWDPMREDFDNSAYDPQYPDDSSSGLVSLDHTRLYVTNIPKGLSDEGVFAAFSKYGRTTELFVSQNSERRYGLIGFETPGEAKLALMKLNRTEPLGLNVRVAHKRKPKDELNRVSRTNDRDRDGRSYRDDTGSVGSNHRRQQDLANGDNMEDLLDDDVGLNNSLDPDSHLELEHLKLEQLKLQEAQLLCKQRMFLLKQAEKKSSSTSRRVLPNGQIFVCVNDKAEAGRDTDASFVAGAGDSRDGKCVACGERADSFCNGCGVTPYCSAACQRRDWHDRHRHVCHNLKRTSGAGLNAPKAEPKLKPETTMTAPAPLRRPRSPEATRDRRDDDSGSDRAPPRKFGPPGSHASVPTTQPTRGSCRNTRGGMNRPNQSHSRSDDAPSGSNDRSDDRSRSHQNGDRSRQANENRERGERRPRTEENGGFNRSRDEKRDDEWNAKPGPKPQDALPLPTVKPKTPLAQTVETKPPPKAQELKETPKEVTAAPPAVVPKNLVPKNCVIELLAVNDSFIVSVDALASECRAGAGLVCLALPVHYSEQYERLVDDAFTRRQQASAACKPTPGETFSYLNPEDGGWYRARCLAPSLAALLDGSKLVELAPAAQCKQLPAEDAELPEFCFLLEDAKVVVGDKLNCTVVSKVGGVLNVSLTHFETGAALGSARARRWQPRVDSDPEPAKPATSSSNAIPSVPRPPVASGSRVLVIDAARPGRVVVRPAARELRRQFDDAVADALVYGTTATPLKEPPLKGQTVIAKFEDGNHYRALCRRVNSKLNKYLLEYIEYGNESVAFLEHLYPCPPELQLATRPTLSSLVSFPMDRTEFTPAALDYLNKLRDDEVELTLTIPSGDQSGASGVAVRLTTERGEDVTREVAALCKPEWQKHLERGGDVLGMATLDYKDVEYVPLPAGGAELDISDASGLHAGLLAGHVRGAPHVARALALDTQLAEYCNSALCRDPYLPKVEELCIAKCPITNRWMRAMLAQQENGAGGREADVLLLDTGRLERVAVAALRKMPAEFVRGLPVAACALEIKDFPKEPTEEQLSRARAHMRVTAEHRGVLRVARADRQDSDPGDYRVDAPDLIRAMML